MLTSARRTTLVIGVSGAVGLIGLRAGMPTSVADRDVEANRVVADALTAQQQGEFSRAARMLVDAWRRNPDAIRLLWEVSPHSSIALLDPDLRLSIARTAAAVGDSLFQRCVEIMMSDALPRAEVGKLRASSAPRTRACARMLDLNASGDSTPVLVGLTSMTPRSATLQLLHLEDAEVRRALDAARRLASGKHHPMVRVAALTMGGGYLRQLGHVRAAAAWDRDAELRARAWGPGAELELYRRRISDGSGVDPRSRSDAQVWRSRELRESAERELLRLRSAVDAGGRTIIASELGRRFQETGRQLEAVAQFQAFASIADSIGDQLYSATAHARLGRSLVKLGRMEEAAKHLQRARATADSAGAIIALREASHDLLHLFESTLSFSEAESAGRDFIRYADRAGTRETRMMGHHDLGWLYRRRGMIAEAEQAFARMIADIDTLGTSTFWAGEYYEGAGQLERARGYYLRALGDPNDMARALSALARIDEMTGQWESALQFARLADGDPNLWDPEYVPLVPGLLARSGRVVEAREQLREARRLILAAGKQTAFARIALESAELELKSGNLDRARQLSDSSAAYAVALGATEIEVRARATSALALARLGASAPALAMIDDAIRRGDAMGIVQLSAHLHTLRAEVLLVTGRRAASLGAYGHAADLVDSIATRLRNDPRRAVFRSMHGRVSNGALDLIAADARSVRSLDQYAAWSIRRKGGVPGMALRAIADRIPVSDALLDYRVGDSTVSALLVTQEGARLVRLPTDAHTLRSLVTAFNAPIAPRIGTAIDLAHVGFDTVAARRLYRALVEPLHGHLGVRTRLTIVPDDVLHLLPFDALVSGTAPLTFMMDAFTIRYATKIAPAPRARRAPGTVVAFAGPGTAVADADREVRMLRAALGMGRDGTVRWIDSRVSRNDLREAAQTADVLHFATHAEANDLEPDLARLALGASNDTTRWLYASEVREWRLRGTLVVLSACETGAGRVAGGEGTLSLSRAFLQAGASGTVATLWPVGAPTADFMGVFYREMARGADPAEALRSARLALRVTHPEPFYWAPFVYTMRGP